jgi:hypothetical protein
VGKVRDVTGQPKTAEQQSSEVHITGRRTSSSSWNKW